MAQQVLVCEAVSICGVIQKFANHDLNEKLLCKNKTVVPPYFTPNMLTISGM